MEENDFTILSQLMVSEQLLKRGITDKKILDAFLAVPRHLFIPENKRHMAYEDSPVPIGEGQTISQPYMVALMVDALCVHGGEKVLEIGIGSGYLAAILQYLGVSVYGVERIPALFDSALVVLRGLGYQVKMSLGDGTLGWQEHAPYDRIIVSAAAPSISPCWLEQLAGNGKLIVPLGGSLQQNLTVIDKTEMGVINKRSVCSCIFVPLIGKFGYQTL